MTFLSEKDAINQIAAWKKEYPNAKFRIEQVPVGNKVGWHVVQTNRFG